MNASTLGLLSLLAVSPLLTGCPGEVTAEPEGTAVLAISGAAAATCALRSNRTVLCWGRGFGAKPSPLVDVHDATQVSVGAQRVCVLRASGEVACAWIREKDHGPATLLHTISNVAQISVGASHACAVTDAGAVLCWGHNEMGQLGDGTGISHDDPVLASAPEAAVEVAAGEFATCARYASGHIRCWGRALGGAVGVDPSDASLSLCESDTERCALSPRLVEGVEHARGLSAGLNAASAVADGQVFAWGYAVYPVESGALQSIGEGADFKSIYVGYERSCVLKQSGQIACWGLADDNDSKSLKRIDGVAAATQVTGGWDHACALEATGRVLCWGGSDWGQLGFEGHSATESFPPTVIEGL
jgi:hypothetical protein